MPVLHTGHSAPGSRGRDLSADADPSADAAPAGGSRFADLLAHPGVHEVCALRSSFGFLAFHGGNLERVTDVIAGEAATRAGASVYAVVQPADLRWHIPSHEVGTGASPTLRAFLDHVEVVVALHGYGRHGRWTDVLLGGTNRRLARHLAAHLRAGLPDHMVTDDLDAIPGPLRGLRADNPVNMPSGGGVQVELPPRVRGLTPHWAHWTGPGPAPPTQALIAALTAAAESWPVRRGPSAHTSNEPPARQ